MIITSERAFVECYADVFSDFAALLQACLVNGLQRIDYPPCA